MKKILLLSLCFIINILSAHNSLNHNNLSLKKWFIEKENTTIEASLMMLKDKTVFLENADGLMLKYPLSSFNLEDQLFVIQKHKQIEALNTPSVKKASFEQNLLKNNFWLLVWFSTLFLTFLLIRFYKNKIQFKYGYVFVLRGQRHQL